MIQSHAERAPFLRNTAMSPSAFRQSAKASVGQLLSKLGDGQWDFKSLRARVALVVSRDEAFKNFEVSGDFKRLGRRTLLLGGLRLRGAGGGFRAAPQSPAYLQGRHRTQKPRRAP